MKTIAELVARTADAYSYDAYSPAGWRACCVMLRRQGYTDDQIEDILYSKLTRWAGDASTKNRYGRYTSKDLERALPSRSYIEEYLDWENRGLLGTALQRTIEDRTESERDQQALMHQLLTEVDEKGL